MLPSSEEVRGIEVPMEHGMKSQKTKAFIFCHVSETRHLKTNSLATAVSWTKSRG
jgi:hypothetical protein